MQRNTYLELTVICSTLILGYSTSGDRDGSLTVTTLTQRLANMEANMEVSLETLRETVAMKEHHFRETFQQYFQRKVFFFCCFCQKC